MVGAAQIASAYGLRDSRAGTENRRGSKRKNAHYESGHSSENPILEGNVVLSLQFGRINLQVQENSRCVIEKLVAIHENDVSPHSCVQLFD